MWFIRWNPHGKATLDEVGMISDGIMAKDKITWDYMGQFNATYVGYSERNLQQVEKRQEMANK